MKLRTKTILTIPLVLSVLFTFIYIFPTELHWITPNWEVYLTEVAILQTLTLAQIVFLLVKLWSFKNIERKLKNDWTWLLILFNVYAAFIFIWWRVDQFQKLNSEDQLKQVNN